jgi:AraC-like DNA-binding protein
MTSGSVTQLEVFSTADVPADQRVELWQAHTSESLMRLRCRTLAERDFHGSTVNLQLPRTRVSRVTAGSAHVIERRADLIRHRPEDALVLFFVLAGEAFFYHEHGVHALRPGQMVACDCDKPFMRGFSDDFEELFFKVPREMLTEVTRVEPASTPIVATFGVHENLIAASLVNLLTAATRVDSANRPDEEQLVALVAMLLGGGDQTDSTAYLAAARRYIDARLGDASLSATAIAAAIGISPRHLSRVFATAGTTVPQYVLARRLAAAKALLTRETSAVLSIADVARRCGLTSSTHFSTSFARQYGQRASDMRREAIQRRVNAPPVLGGTR